jgi:aerobic-type carbon monoxide dehydrogenase small subunit (CoxS/CutS family)
VRITVNGSTHEIASAPLTPLLHVLRDELHITSPKAGCQQGSCGTCTVIVDGEARRSCLLPVAAVDGAEITTLEGIGTPDALSPVQVAFLERAAAQCGFCTPGFITAATALLASNPTPSKQQIRAALSGHYCRCTGYVKILEAVEAAAGGAR